MLSLTPADDQSASSSQQDKSDTGAAALMKSLPEADWLLADRGYDADWFRESLVGKGTTPCIPGRKSRKKPVKYDKRRYKRRNRLLAHVNMRCQVTH